MPQSSACSRRPLLPPRPPRGRHDALPPQVSSDVNESDLNPGITKASPFSRQGRRDLFLALLFQSLRHLGAKSWERSKEASFHQLKPGLSCRIQRNRRFSTDSQCDCLRPACLLSVPCPLWHRSDTAKCTTYLLESGRSTGGVLVLPSVRHGLPIQGMAAVEPKKRLFCLLLHAPSSRIASLTSPN